MAEIEDFEQFRGKDVNVVDSEIVRLWDGEVVFLPDNTIFTADYQPQRIRIFYDSNMLITDILIG
ncbi:MAG: hypothetical protein WC284_14450 [Candidimonas sp.]